MQDKPDFSKELDERQRREFAKQASQEDRDVLINANDLDPLKNEPIAESVLASLQQIEETQETEGQAGAAADIPLAAVSPAPPIEAEELEPTALPTRPPRDEVETATQAEPLPQIPPPPSTPARISQPKEAPAATPADTAKDTAPAPREQVQEEKRQRQQDAGKATDSKLEQKLQPLNDQPAAQNDRNEKLEHAVKIRNEKTAQFQQLLREQFAQEQGQQSDAVLTGVATPRNVNDGEGATSRNEMMAAAGSQFAMATAGAMEMLTAAFIDATRRLNRIERIIREGET